MLYPMKSKNQRTAGNAMSWALGATLGVILGIALLIAIPRMMFPPAATGADAPQTPAATASTGDSGGAATTTESTAATETSSTETSSTEADSSGASSTESTDTAATSEAAAGEANAEAGKTVYAGTCAGCHGTEGQGGVGPKLDMTKTWSDAEFTAAVREGKAPEKELSPVMPRFAEAQLSAQQIADVHAHLKTLY